MYKRISIVLASVASCLLLTSCAKTPPKPTATSSASINPAMVHYSQDTKGSTIFPKQRVATGKRVFIFDPKYTAWAAYDANGELIKTGRASGGASYCADISRPCRTVIGQFTVNSKGGSDCISSKYPVGEGGAKMPYCMFFYRGYSIHGSSHVPDYNASHGCIRVTPSAAQWLNHNFIQNGTTVIVKPYS